MPEYQPIAKIPNSVDDVTRAYLECAEWCGIDDEQREAFELAVDPQWEPKTILEAEETCRDFDAAAEAAIGSDAWEMLDPEQVGHDLWLTRNHHGAGFWDRGLGKVGDELTKLAHPYGEAYVDFDPEREYLTIS